MLVIFFLFNIIFMFVNLIQFRNFLFYKRFYDASSCICLDNKLNEESKKEALYELCDMFFNCY